jgi:nitroreductase
MRKRLSKPLLLCLSILLVWPSWSKAQELASIKLNEPNKKRGSSVMEALSLRASVREWSDKEISVQDLSDLLWAANGINRPESKKRTAASAMNSQDVDIYVFNKEGVYLYDAVQHSLMPILAGDHRSEIGMPRRGGPGGPGAPPGAPPAGAPPAKPAGGASAPASVHLVLVSDNSRFGNGTPELKREWGAIDVGLVSQNIAVFCAGTGMATRPRASVDKEKVRAMLKLKELQFPVLEHPVGYPK